MIRLAALLAVLPLAATGSAPTPSQGQQDRVRSAHLDEPVTLTLIGSPARATLLVEAPRSGVLRSWVVPRSGRLPLRLRALRGESPGSPRIAESLASDDSPIPLVEIDDVEIGDRVLLVIESLVPIEELQLIDVYSRAPRETADTLKAGAFCNEQIRSVQTLLQIRDHDAARDKVTRLLEALMDLDPDACSDQVDLALVRAVEIANSWFDTRSIERALFASLQHRIDYADGYMPAASKRSLRRRRILGVLLREHQRMDESIEVLQVALERAETALGDGHEFTLGFRAELAESLSWLGRLEEVYQLCEENLSAVLAKHPPDPDEVNNARFDLGKILFVGGNHEAALDALNETLATFRDEGLSEESQLVQLALVALGDCYLHLQDYRNARRLQEHFLSIANPVLVHPREIEKVRWNLACSRLWLGDAHLALDVFEEFQGLEELIPTGQAHGLFLNWALVLMETGDVVSAADLLDRLLDVALRVFKQRGEMTLRTASSHAMTHTLLGEAQLAWDSLSQLMDPENGGPIVLDSAVPRSLYGAAAQVALQLGKYAEAASLAGELLASIPSENRKFDPMAARALAVQVDAFTGLDDPKAARDAFMELCAWLRSDAEARSLLTTPREAHAENAKTAPLVDALLAAASGGVLQMSNGLEEQLYASVEASRAVEFLAHRVQRISKSEASDGRLRELREKAQTANRRLWIAMNAQGEDAPSVVPLVRELDAVTTELGRQLGGRAALPKLDARSLGAELADDEVAVTYRLHEVRMAVAGGDATEAIPHLTAWVVTPSGQVERVHLGSAQVIRRAVESWHDALGVDAETRQQSRSAARAAGDRVRQLVLDPLREHFEQGTRRLLVAPDGALHRVPFEALPETDGSPIGARLRVRIVPALTALQVKNRDEGGDSASQPRAELIALGGIDYGRSGEAEGGQGTGFQPLPHTEREVVKILATWNRSSGSTGRGGQLITGSRATRERFIDEAQSATHLHLATHGTFYPESVSSESAGSPGADAVDARRRAFEGLRPMLTCGLAFAGANEEPAAAEEPDGFLAAAELAQLDLEGCELAVLSACNTGRGVADPGQGTASLQTALHAAGTRDAITSLWAVDDVATAEMMQRLYRRLADGEDAAEALWAAKMEMRATQADDRHWAGWVLSGTGR